MRYCNQSLARFFGGKRAKHDKVVSCEFKPRTVGAPWEPAGLSSDRTPQLEEQLTAVRISNGIVVHTDGATGELPLGLNIRRNALRDVGPHGLGIAVVFENRRRLPCCGELVAPLVCGRVVVRRALELGICDIGSRSVTGEQGERTGACMQDNAHR